MVFLLAVSCFRAEDFDTDRMSDIKMDYDIALPLADTRLDMENLMDLAGGVYVPDEEGLLHIVYAMEPVGFSFLGDVDFPGNLSFSASGNHVPYFRIDTVLAFSRHDTLPVGVAGISEGAEIESLHLESVDLQMDFSHTFADPMRMHYVFPNLTDFAGVPVSVERTVGQGVSEPVRMALSDVVLHPVAGRICLLVEGDFSVEVAPDPADTLVHYGNYSMAGSMENLVFARFDGFVPTISYRMTGELPVRGLGLERMKAIDFREATVTADMKVEGLSAPLRIETSRVDVLHAEGTAEVALFPENYDVAYPAFDAEPLVKESSVETDMTAITAERPHAIRYEIAGSVNPEADRALVQAMEKDAGMYVGLTCDLPVWFSADNYALTDTLEIAGNEIGEDTRINYFLLKSIVQNAFPLDLVLDVRFLDLNRKPLLTLFEGRKVEAAAVGADEHVSEPVVERFEDELSGEEVGLVKQAAYVEITARISSLEKKDVKIFASSETESFLNVKMGFRTKITQTIEF